MQNQSLSKNAINEPTKPLLTIDGALATIRFRKPTFANRLNPEDLTELRDLVAKLNGRDDILVLRFVADGKYFCSGYDISSLAGDEAPSSLYFGETVDIIESARPVTIAAIQGGAYGGGTDLALACDFRVGTTAANMFMPATKLGLHFYSGGMSRYITRLGLNQAKRLFLLAEKIEAEEMLRIGFLNEIVESESLYQRVNDLSSKLAQMGPLSLFGIKRHLNQIAAGQIDVEAIERGVRLSESSWDIREGASAWKEKRKPNFRGV